ncbi:MAG: TlpA family protein disulfide reductase [Chloroflexi bacterium]|nr:TlpA family protein disulfide reductase [Chloroflexota bacterium]
MNTSTQSRALPGAPATTPDRNPARTGAQRLVVGLVFVATVALLALLGAKLAADAGWFGGTATRVASGVPGIFAGGQFLPSSARRPADFALQLFSGETLRSADLRGKPVLVNFWASWCAPCREEAPVLEQFWRDHRDQGIVVVGIDVWDTESDARRFIKDTGVTYPNGPDPRGKIAVDYGLSGVPETVLLDQEGRIVRKWVGPFTEQTKQVLLREIARLTGS